MRENGNDLSWVKYLKRVQYQKNTTHHSTIGLTPYEALYNHKPSSGPLDFGIPSEVANDIHTEEDLECIINSINSAVEEEDNVSPDIHEPMSANTQPGPELPFQHEPFLDSSSSSSLVISTLPDAYIEDISQPIPYLTRITGNGSLSASDELRGLWGFDKWSPFLYRVQWYNPCVLWKNEWREGYGSQFGVQNVTLF